LHTGLDLVAVPSRFRAGAPARHDSFGERRSGKTGQKALWMNPAIACESREAGSSRVESMSRL